MRQWIVVKDRDIGRMDAATRTHHHMQGDHPVSNGSILSSSLLHAAGEPVEFMLEDRQQPLCGPYADGKVDLR